MKPEAQSLDTYKYMSSVEVSRCFTCIMDSETYFQFCVHSVVEFLTSALVTGEVTQYYVEAEDMAYKWYGAQHFPALRF